MRRFLAVFLLVLVALFLLELTAPVQRILVQPWTSFLALASAFIVRLFDANVLSYGNVLQDMRSGSGIAIEAGCNGVEACIMLAAAVFAYPAALRARVAGLLVGSAAIQLLNLVRIVSLYYLVQWSVPAFEFAHLYLWQALIMLDVLVVWLVWLRWVTRRQFAAAAAVTGAA
jgi:exosortase H (IPTLxxWG-CTERM-specific)